MAARVRQNKMATTEKAKWFLLRNHDGIAMSSSGCDAMMMIMVISSRCPPLQSSSM